jgi:hypothetical protein
VSLTDDLSKGVFDALAAASAPGGRANPGRGPVTFIQRQLGAAMKTARASQISIAEHIAAVKQDRIAQHGTAHAARQPHHEPLPLRY